MMHSIFGIALTALALVVTVKATTLTTAATPTTSDALLFPDPLPAITPAPDASRPLSPRGNDDFTINVYTKGDVPGLHVAWEHNSDSPSNVNGVQNQRLGSKTMGVYPTGWAGRIAIGPDPDLGVINRGSLIEASFIGGHVSYDVSYVQGYSVPIVCSCKNVFNTGCNIPLFRQKEKCPEMGPGNTCYNPFRNSGQGRGTRAQAFFEPCRGGAMAYPKDYDSIVSCTENQISCCVGHECPASVQQHQRNKRAIGGHTKRSEPAGQA